MRIKLSFFRLLIKITRTKRVHLHMEENAGEEEEEKEQTEVVKKMERRSPLINPR